MVAKFQSDPDMLKGLEKNKDTQHPFIWASASMSWRTVLLLSCMPDGGSRVEQASEQLCSVAVQMNARMTTMEMKRFDDICLRREEASSASALSRYRLAAKV